MVDKGVLLVLLQIYADYWIWEYSSTQFITHQPLYCPLRQLLYPLMLLTPPGVQTTDIRFSQNTQNRAATLCIDTAARTPAKHEGDNQIDYQH